MAEPITTHRRDIDGLRAVAVVLVVLFHAGVRGLEAGFVGVDVFFVLSGYLITGLLLTEHEATDRVSLAGFWARRIRRLVPALALVLGVTLLASIALLSPLRWREVGVDAGAAALSVSNVRFGLRSVDYFGGLAAPSPLLHTWSLGVEEQFYLFWPIVVAVLGRLGRRRGVALRSTLRWLVPVGCVASFALGVLLTRRGTPWAYYALPSRWWEIGVGAAIACWRGRWAPSPVVSAVLAVGGWAGLAASLILIDSTTPFPGFAAALPVAATAGFVIAGWRAGGAGRVLELPPLQWIGLRSYSWYLWHWPVLILGQAVGIGDTVWARVGLAAASLAPAAVSSALVENPIRRAPRLLGRARPNLLLGLGCVALVVAGSGALYVAGPRTIDGDPMLRALQSAEDERVADIADAATTCPGSGTAGCPTVLLLGDSHAAHWQPALLAASRELGARLVARTRGGCPPWDLHVANAGSTSPSEVCVEFQRDTPAEIARLRPDVIVVASGNYAGRMLEDGRIVAAADEGRVWETAAKRTLTALGATGTPVVLVLDNPYAPFDPVGCLGWRRDANACTFDLSESPATVARDRAGEARAARVAGVRALVDVGPRICSPRCQTWQDGEPVYADVSHLTAAFTQRRADEFARTIAPLLAP